MGQRVRQRYCIKMLTHCLCALRNEYSFSRHIMPCIPSAAHRHQLYLSNNYSQEDIPLQSIRILTLCGVQLAQQMLFLKILFFLKFITK